MATIQTGPSRNKAASNPTRNRRSVERGLLSERAGTERGRISFDVGDMLHELAGFWAQENDVDIQVKSPLGLRANENESLVRQILATELGNVLGQRTRQGRTSDRTICNRRARLSTVTIIASELDGQIRLAVQQNAKSMVMTIDKAMVTSDTQSSAIAG